MAKTEFGVNHNLAVKIWSKLLAREAFRATYISRFVGKGSDSLIQEKVDLKKSAGDRITCGLRVQLDGEGVLGDATLEGTEEAMQFYNDNLYVDQLRHAVRINGRMTEQRVPYNLREEAMAALRDWFAQRMDVTFANHICGNTAVTDLRYTGNNAVTAPTTNRILRVNGRASDEAITSADTFALEYIDYAVERARTASVADSTGPVIRPIMVDGSEMYVMFLHDFQVTDLRTNTSTGQWLDIQRAAMQGGDIKSNPIFTGALGVYNGVVLHQWARVTRGVNSSSGAAISTVRRAVLCGAQAAMMAFGGDNSDTRYTWNEQMFDYDNQFGVAAGSIFGMKKTRFAPESGSTTNREDFGTVVVSSYAAAHTGA